MSHSRRLSLAIFALCSLGAVLFARQIGWASHFPKDWQLPVAKFISRGAAGAIDQLAGTTRLLAALIDWPMKLLMALLAQGQALGVTWMPPLSWAGIVLAVVLLGRRTGGAGLATLLGAGCAYLLFFGQWPSAMLTLASVAIAVPFALLSGLVLGILAWQVPRLDRLFLTPLLDLMQTVPAFAYLVPTLVRRTSRMQSTRDRRSRMSSAASSPSSPASPRAKAAEKNKSTARKVPKWTRYMKAAYLGTLRTSDGLE